MSYLRTCPICGAELAPNMDGPWTPPWRCDACFMSWWVAELTPEARASFDRERRDHGYAGSPSQKAVREGVRIEAEEAAVRGTCIRREQIGLVPKETLSALLARHRVAPDFAAQMTAQR